MRHIGFNEPHLTGKETEYILDAVSLKKLSGNGKYTKLCHHFFESRYKFNKCLLTSSCTDALEMAALLIDIKAGDEIVMPSFTFVSSAHASLLRGAKIIFADSMNDNPNIDADRIEELVTPKTKAIVVVHYAGIACEMDKIMDVANRNNLYVIEDAAQAIDNYYIRKDGSRKPLGSIGHLAAFSFHETKNIISGEGGMLVINDKKFDQRAEIIWEKGTNRSAFFRGEIDKYGWVDLGSSFLPSDIIAAFLYAQLENLDAIQEKRKSIWNSYYKGLYEWAKEMGFQTPCVPPYSTNNGHMFYLVCDSETSRAKLIEHLKKSGIYAVFHYQSLHKSPFYRDQYSGTDLENSDRYSECLLRLPLHYGLTNDEMDLINSTVRSCF